MKVSKGTRLTWVVRGDSPAPFVPQDGDGLPLRARLLRDAAALVHSPPKGLTFLAGSTVDSLARAGSGVSVMLATPRGRKRLNVSRVISCVGYSPDNSLYRELQVHECYATLGPMKLSAALLGAAAGDCLTQVTHGVETLLNPEKNFFLLGSKSYGRNNTFLLRVGFQQVDEVFAHLGAR